MQSHLSFINRVPGLLMVAISSALLIWVCEWSPVQKTGISALTLAIVLGMLMGNTLFPKVAHSCGSGVDYAKSSLLRLGIILYGFRITFTQIASVGWSGALADIAVIGMTFGLALLIGIVWLKMDRDTVILIGAGSSICGAAAILATEPVVRGQAHRVSVAVATVVVYGTLAMFIYPWLYPYLGFSETKYGLYVGSTVHEVAQVVAAGKSISDTATNNAVIEKMLRVMMLSPFLLMLSAVLNRQDGGRTGNNSHRQISVVPWFALGFVAVSGFNTLDWVPKWLVSNIVNLDLLLLTMAMFALGLRTSVGSLKQTGVKPLILGGMLFLILCVGGYGLDSILLP